MPAKKTKSSVNNKEKVSIIRFIYLYIITAITFIVFIIGAVTIVDVVLKEFVFDIEEDYPAQPQMICERYLQTSEDGMTENEAYEKCIEKQEELEKEREKRFISRSSARRITIGIAQVLVGFPLWLFHWRVIERDRKERKSGRTTR
jgi:hypothetical protein